MSSLAAPPSSTDWEAIRVWRRQMRQTLIDQRLGTPQEIRRTLGEQAKHHLREHVELRKFGTLGMYSPIRGEINIRDLAREHIEAGGQVGLPVVVTKGAPVEFWRWEPGAPMRRGLWDIPIPAERELVIPDALLVPLVGFDAQAYRLGYGAGYYDRTIAAAASRPFCIGFGYSMARLPTIYPQPHDIPMDVIVTDEGVLRRT